MDDPNLPIVQEISAGRATMMNKGKNRIALLSNDQDRAAAISKNDAR